MSIAARAVLIAAALTACARRVPVQPMTSGDEYILYAAWRVRTMDPSKPLADALVVHKGRIEAVGARAELEREYEGIRVVEMPSAVVVPGLTDAHVHLRGLGNRLAIADLTVAKSEAEAVEIMKAAPAESHRGEWLEGRGWDQNKWQGQQFPGRALLDAAFPTTPVFLKRIDGHAAWVNGEALRRVGITSKTPDPQGGRILHDANGEPTGVLIDNASDAVDDKLPLLTDDQQQTRLSAALMKCAAVGLTGVHDAGMDVRTFGLLQQWDAAGGLPLRVYAMAEGGGAGGDLYLGRGIYRGRMLEMRAVKFVIDGALGSRGGALWEPYSDEPTQSGLILWSLDELQVQMKKFMERGFQVAVHAIGDKANSLTMDLIAKVAAEVPGNPGRHRVEHAQVLRREDLPRLAKGGFVASMQPTHATSDMPWAPARLGPERVKGAYAWKSVLEAGVPLAFGSDFPIEAPEPLYGIYSARSRQDENGKPEGGWTPEQRLTGEQALAAFTVGSAFASFSEHQRGRLVPGYDADFTVLSTDPVEDAPMKVRNARVLLTVVAGRPVYRAGAQLICSQELAPTPPAGDAVGLVGGPSVLVAAIAALLLAAAPPPPAVAPKPEAVKKPDPETVSAEVPAAKPEPVKAAASAPDAVVKPAAVKPNYLKLAAPPFSGVNLDDKVATFFSEHFASALVQRGIQVMTPSEINAMIGLERSKQLAGCAEDASSCVAELANALGVDGLVAGTVAKFGSTIQANIKVFNSRDGSAIKVVSLKAGSEEQLLETLSAQARELAPELLSATGKARSPTAINEPDGKNARLNQITISPPHLLVGQYNVEYARTIYPWLVLFAEPELTRVRNAPGLLRASVENAPTFDNYDADGFKIAMGARMYWPGPARGFFAGPIFEIGTGSEILWGDAAQTIQVRAKSGTKLGLGVILGHTWVIYDVIPLTVSVGGLHGFLDFDHGFKGLYRISTGYIF